MRLKHQQLAIVLPRQQDIKQLPMISSLQAVDQQVVVLLYRRIQFQQHHRIWKPRLQILAPQVRTHKQLPPELKIQRHLRIWKLRQRIQEPQARILKQPDL
uniref:(northern house mosquito) hypothetical protein n=1 Tax=Culex pipiens TaxID=7175 RepID=A0A8D8NW06_CULPI